MNFPRDRPFEIKLARPEDAEVLNEIQRAAALAAYGHIFPPERYPTRPKRV